MKIIGLKILGARLISAIEMKFGDRGLIQFIGRNKQGKTTILDCLEILFKGVKAVPRDFIQHGKAKAQLTCKVGDYDIKRIFTNGGKDKFEIRNKEGLKLDIKPQAFLDALQNELTFNPFPFIAKSPDQKLKFMMDLFGVNFEKEDKEIKELEEDRKFVGRELKNLGEIEAVEEVKKVDVAGLFEGKKRLEVLNLSKREGYQLKKDSALKKIIDFNDNQKEKTMIVEKEEGIISSLRTEETFLVEEFNKATDRLKKITDRLKNVRTDIDVKNENIVNIPKPQELKALEIDILPPDLESIEEIETQIKEAIEANQKAGLYNDYLKKVELKETKQIEYDTFSTEINVIREDKKRRLSVIHIPVSGLEIKEDGIYHDGIFSENWSDSEAVTISAELCVAMNPELRAICINNGESYDKESLKSLEEWSQKHDIQVFIAIVDEIPETMEDGVFYIEEGNVITQEETRK